MSFLTHVRQVLQRDVRDARWPLVAFVATLGYAVVQGRQLLEPVPLNESFRMPADWSAAAAAVAPIVTFLLAGVLTLAFAPIVGRASRSNQAWHTLPIAPTAVWVVRMLWVLAAFMLALTVTWLVLLPLPLGAASRLHIAASVAMNTAAIMLAGAVIASVAASIRAFLGWMLLTPMLLLIVPLLMLLLPDEARLTSLNSGLEPGALAISSVHLFGLLLLSAATLWALLHARRVGWLGRVGAGAAALTLLAANVMRMPAPVRSDVNPASPTLLVVGAASASLERLSGPNILSRISDDMVGAPADLMRAKAARRASVAVNEEASSQFMLRLEPQLSARTVGDRLVFRPRAATIRNGSGAWRFTTIGSDVVVAPGDPSPGEQIRWLNEPAPNVLTAFASATRRPSEVLPLTDATASFTLDVERQQAEMLAQIPLDGSPATGPWRRFARAELTAPTDSSHTMRVSLKRLSGTHDSRWADDAVAGEFTYVLRHRGRGEALHLSRGAQYSSNGLGWALSPSLIDAVHAGLLPTGTTAATMRDVANTEWLRGATLVVIGWRTVERGALTIEAPLTTVVAVR